MATHNQLGKWGEDMAIEHLVARGYTIVDHGKSIGKKECDIIAIGQGAIHFIEVKTRSHPLDDPCEAVTPAKKRRIARFAENYIISFDIPFTPRLDIIAINGTPEDGVSRFEWLIDAWNPADGR